MSSLTSPVTRSSPVAKTSATTRPSPSPTFASGCCRSFLSPRRPSSTWATCCTLSAWRRRGERGKRSSGRQGGTRRTTILSITMELAMEEAEVAGKKRSRLFAMNTGRFVSAGLYWGPTSLTSSSRLCLRWASSWGSTSSMASTWGRSINVAAGPAQTWWTASSPGQSLQHPHPLDFTNPAEVVVLFHHLPLRALWNMQKFKRKQKSNLFSFPVLDWQVLKRVLFSMYSDMGSVATSHEWV